MVIPIRGSVSAIAGAPPTLLFLRQTGDTAAAGKLGINVSRCYIPVTQKHERVEPEIGGFMNDGVPVGFHGSVGQLTRLLYEEVEWLPGREPAPEAEPVDASAPRDEEPAPAPPGKGSDDGA